MKLLDRFFVRKKNRHYYFKYTKQFMHKIELNNRELIVQICKDFDVPFIEYQWDIYIERSKKWNPIVKYINLMKLEGYKYYTFKDSEWLNKLNRIKENKNEQKI